MRIDYEVAVVAVAAIASAFIARFVEAITLKGIHRENATITKTEALAKENGSNSTVGRFFSCFRSDTILPTGSTITPVALRQRFDFKGENSFGQINTDSMHDFKCKSYIFQRPLEAELDNLQSELRRFMMATQDPLRQKFAGMIPLTIVSLILLCQ